MNVHSVLRATDPSKAHARRLQQWITEELDADGQLLWSMFVEFDESLRGTLNWHDIRRMLEAFDTMAEPADIEMYLESLPEGKRELTFADFVDWIELQKESPQSRLNSLGLQTTLKTRYVGKKVKNWSWDLVFQTTLEKRMDMASEDGIRVAIARYGEIIAHLQRKKIDAEDRRLREEEEILWQKSEGRTIDIATQFRLEQTFRKFAKEMKAQDGSPLLAQAQLGALCQYLDYDLSNSVATMTIRLYPDPMDLYTFVRWWGARVESGKAKSFA